MGSSDDDIQGHLEHGLRLDAEEAEYDAAKLAARRRLLWEVAFDAMARGDLVAVSTFGRSITGTVAHARGDLATIETEAQSVDVNLRGPVSLVVVQYAYSPGHGRSSGAAGFEARLREYELTGEQVEIVAPLAGVVATGQIEAVAKDHVMVITLDEQTLFIPLAQIAFVIQHESRIV
jgi:hypothetical protein